MRGATRASYRYPGARKISIHAPLAGRDVETDRPVGGVLISIHAPLAGRDTMSYFHGVYNSISIHAPLAGRDKPSIDTMQAIMLFQSTRPLRGATELDDNSHNTPEHFNPRAPCGARPAVLMGVVMCGVISIHAPLAGRDSPTLKCPLYQTNFNPRAPCGARRDPPKPRNRPADFNPRAPCGARRWRSVSSSPQLIFQSTRPLRGATVFA